MDDIHILGSLIAYEEGGAVAKQFKDWARGEALSEQNGNAMRLSRAILARVLQGNNSMHETVTDLLDRLQPEDILSECMF
jgi:hypothetical protein